MPGNTCLLLAHPDDEFFIYSHVKRLSRQGIRFRCVYITDAAPLKFDAAKRFEESRRVLGRAGVSPEDIFTPGVDLAVPDLAAHVHLERIYPVVSAICQEHEIDCLVIPTWEGGHVDHDAAHLLGQALAANLSTIEAVTEFSLYNAYRRPKGFFSVMRLIRERGNIQEHRLSCSEAWEHIKQIREYPTQWKTFLGLGPESIVRLILLRTEQTRTYARSEVNYLEPPHSGVLLYESRFGTPFEEFLNVTRPFIEARIGAPTRK